ncbi:Abi family protein [Saccharospirillum impatiens]|jgi:abortive infection bacteriophage resistance protein|uniref:Abi family protein n=1 Tax=Saccharospirillum impatiens TaxID=169438 RepID=UPI00041F4066|nr:Abi family protein [Saccharospirillum impatiens]
MITFNKPAISPDEQVALLEDRGLTINDRTGAQAFLRSVSFFRLTPYMRPFQLDSNHQFVPGTGFRQLAELYDFDRRLRLLVMDAIERAEVATRAQISNHMGANYGSHWYLHSDHFKNQHPQTRLLDDIREKQQHQLRDFQRECTRIDQLRASPARKQALKQRRQKESYARHYVLTYTEPELMPNWAMLEEITLGTLSHLYKNLSRDSDKKAIARALALEAPLLESWLHTLTVVRNICAHHSRLWNRELGIKPATPKSPRVLWPSYLKDDTRSLHTRIAVILPILQHFMLHCAPHASWKQRLFELCAEFPDIPLQAMGLPITWQNDAFWQQ